MSRPRAVRAAKPHRRRARAARAPKAAAPASGKRPPGRPTKLPRKLFHRTKNYWFVLHRGVQLSCGTDDEAKADDFLQNYKRGVGDAARVALRPILEKAYAEGGPTAWIYERLLRFWGDKRVRDLNEASCRRYLAWSQALRGFSNGSGRDSMGRNELKLLRARTRAFCEHVDPDYEVSVWLPMEGLPRTRFLFADEISRFVHVALGRILDSAAADGWLRDPATGLYAYRDERTRRRWEPVARLVMLGAYTATRLGNMREARWQPGKGHGHVDLEKSIFYRTDKQAEDALKSAPPVPLHPKLHLFLLGCRRRDRAAGFKRVIHGRKDTEVRIEELWEEVREAAGLGDDVLRHTLRHSTATLMMAAGVHEREIAEYMGLTVENLFEHYAQADPRLTAAVAAVLDDAVRGVATVVSLAKTLPRRSRHLRIARGK